MILYFTAGFTFFLFFLRRCHLTRRHDPTSEAFCANDRTSDRSLGLPTPARPSGRTDGRRSALTARHFRDFMFCLKTCVFFFLYYYYIRNRLARITIKKRKYLDNNASERFKNTRKFKTSYRRTIADFQKRETYGLGNLDRFLISRSRRATRMYFIPNVPNSFCGDDTDNFLCFCSFVWSLRCFRKA